MGENFQKSALLTFLQFVRVRAAHQPHGQRVVLYFMGFSITNVKTKTFNEVSTFVQRNIKVPNVTSWNRMEPLSKQKDGQKNRWRGSTDF